MGIPETAACDLPEYRHDENSFVGGDAAGETLRMPNQTNQSVVILATGGTIAGTTADPCAAVAYQAATVAVSALVAAVPGLGADRLELEQVVQMDSKDMDHATWRLLAERVAHHLERPDVQGIVITHGTDTLEETAYFLHRVLSPAKPVVLTAAMRPSNALLADGPQNLLDAVRLARQPGRGVMVCVLGQVYAPDDVRKAHGYRLDAFRSGGGGVMGVLQEGTLNRFRDWPACTPIGLEHIPIDPSTWPEVVLLFSHADVRAELIETLIGHAVQGIVIAGTGNGTIHCRLEHSLRKARERGITVWRASRCAEGGVVGEDEWPSAGALSPVQSRIELMLCLMDTNALADSRTAGQLCPHTDGVRACNVTPT